MAMRVKNLDADEAKQNEAAKIRRTKQFKSIRDDLMIQLIKTGANTPAFENMVDQYMDFYVTTQLCKLDIQNRGVFVEYDNGGGQSGVTDNPSVNYMRQANTQMIKILQYLKISVQQTTVGETDDEL